MYVGWTRVSTRVRKGSDIRFIPPSADENLNHLKKLGSSDHVCAWLGGFEVQSSGLTRVCSDQRAMQCWQTLQTGPMVPNMQRRRRQVTAVADLCNQAKLATVDSHGQD
jgi:hypothetical protein